MNNIFRYLREQRMEALRTAMVCRLVSLANNFDSYRKGKFEMIGRPIQFAPSLFDFLVSPRRTFVTLVTQFRYFRSIEIGAPKDVERAYEHLLFAYTKQRYGIRLNVESFLILGKLEDEALSHNQIRKILADTTIYSDSNGKLVCSEHHRIVDLCAKFFAIVLLVIGVSLFVGLSYEVFKAKCVPTCAWFGAIEFFLIISLLTWTSYRIGFRVPRFELFRPLVLN